MTLRDRIGIDVGRWLKLEDAIEWAAKQEVSWIDSQLDAGTNATPSMDETRAAAVRRARADKVHLGLHASSAVNVAEVAPFVSDAVDRPMSRLRQDSARVDRHGTQASISLPTRHNGWPPVSID